MRGCGGGGRVKAEASHLEVRQDDGRPCPLSMIKTGLRRHLEVRKDDRRRRRVNQEDKSKGPREAVLADQAPCTRATRVVRLPCRTQPLHLAQVARVKRNEEAHGGGGDKGTEDKRDGEVHVECAAEGQQTDKVERYPAGMLAILGTRGGERQPGTRGGECQS